MKWGGLFKNMQENKMTSYKKLFYIAVGLSLVVFAFTDLQISQLVYNPKSAFGWFFESFGELPLAFVGVFSSIGMLVTYKKTGRIIDNIHTLGFGFLTVYHSFVGGMLVKVHTNINVILTLVICVGLILTMLLLVHKVPKENYGLLRKVSIIGSVLAIAAVLVITVIKMFWGRLRFRSMQDNLNQFSPWYLPQGFTTNNEYMSLPSGHSANSSVIIMITLLPYLYPRLNKSRKLFYAVSILWILCVMISRIIVGAHFASDVTLGMTLSITMFFLLNNKYLKEY